jgi:hypothetical protein
MIVTDDKKIILSPSVEKNVYIYIQVRKNIDIFFILRFFYIFFFFLHKKKKNLHKKKFLHKKKKKLFFINTFLDYFLTIFYHFYVQF